MTKYLLGMIAGMSLVPFAYFAAAVNPTEDALKFYVALSVVPVLVVAGTAVLAFKFNEKVGNG